MSRSGRRARARQLATGVAALALVVGGTVAGAPVSSASLLQPLSATATVPVNGGEALAGQTTPIAITVTNDATSSRAALAAFTLVVPAGAGPVSAQAVSTSSGGAWKQIVTGCGRVPDCAALVSVYATLPLGRSVVYGGSSVTSNFTFTAPAAPTTLTFKLIGIGGGLFATQDYPTVQVGPGPATSIVFDSVAGYDPINKDFDPNLPPSVDSDFHATFHLLDAYGNPTTDGPAITMTAGGPGSLSPDPAPATNGLVVGRYSAVTSGLLLTLSGGSLSATRTTAVVGTGTVATPNKPVALSDGSNRAGTAAATLRNGADGVVTLTAGSCDPGQDAGCSSGVQVELEGDFKASGAPLYSFDSPAQASWTCPDCVHKDEHSGSYLHNYDCTGNSCSAGRNSPFGEREVEEDFQNFPVYVSLRTTDGQGNVSDTPFARAPRCIPLPTGNNDPQKAYLLHERGVMVSSEAKAVGFCVDVNAISRAGNCYTGALTIPVLFVEDMRMRP